jgi:hypothetical protein
VECQHVAADYGRCLRLQGGVSTLADKRLAEALELLGECYGVRAPEPEDDAGVVLFLAEAVCALALDRKTLSTTRQGGPIHRDRGKSSGSLSRSHHRAE